jgi:RecA-family ATPase
MSPFEIEDEAGIILSELEPDEPAWLWKNWLQLQLVTILVGPSGCGKSTLTADLIARVTRGDAMPDGTPCMAPGGAVIISLEENTAQTVLPRLMAAGADLDRVVDLSKVRRRVLRPGDPVRSPFTLPDDLPVLERAVKRVKASLVVIDPLMSVVNPAISTFRNQTARKVVTTLQDYAERLGVAVLIVNHFTKGRTDNPLNAMAGSKGFSDVVRSVWLFDRDGSDPALRVLSLLKHNNAPDVPQIVLRHNGRTVQYERGMTAAQQAYNEQQKLSQGRLAILGLLASHPQWEYTPTEVAQTLDMHYDTAKSLLRRMAQDGQIGRGRYGYQAVSAPVAP